MQKQIIIFSSSINVALSVAEFALVGMVQCLFISLEAPSSIPD